MRIEPSVLCVHAHPDDEALFTGGVLARYADQGIRTGVVTCTWQDGDVRVDELRQSLKILGAGDPRLLGYRDSGMDGPGTFCEAPLDEAVGRLVGHLREFRPDVVITYDAFGTYGHPDHVQAHRVTLAAVEAAGYPQLYPGTGPAWRTRVLYQATFPRSVIQRTLGRLSRSETPPDEQDLPGVPDDQLAVRVDVRPWAERKWAAMLAHKSELDRGAGAARFVALPGDVREQLLGTEWFIRRDFAPVGGAPKPDLY